MFTDTTGWITGHFFAQVAYSFRDSGYTYEEYDCIGFVNLVRTTAGVPTLAHGTNTLWRDPDDLYYKDTYTNAISRFGHLPQGCLLFRIKSEDDPTYNVPPIPPQYYMDGIGNVTHVGIYTDLGLGVMQSGGYGGSGVHQSVLDTNYFNYVALPVYCLYPEYPIMSLSTFLTMVAGSKRKDVLKNVKRIIR